MVIPVHLWYEIIFLTQHLIGPKRSHASVAKAVKCDVTTVKYWLKRWKQSKDLSDSIRSGRPWVEPIGSKNFGPESRLGPQQTIFLDLDLDPMHKDRQIRIC